ncbi:MAG: transferase [Spirochaetes bacterium]|nr:transferase [Spirochaetota bacterium]MBN2769246.1 transferase [Spirochaetota bacterium]
MHLLIPGRHHLLTNYQFHYLHSIIHTGPGSEKDIHGNILKDNKVESIIFAVTSANHHGTRRNPLSYAFRAMAIRDFGNNLPIPVYSFAVEDAGQRDDFAQYTIKCIAHASDNMFALTPDNCIVICSTPVASMYDRLGFSILGAEKTETESSDAIFPWTLMEKIANSCDWRSDREILRLLHPASYRLFTQYRLGEKIKFLFNDPIIGDDGDITQSRDYASYVRQMDDIADIKWRDVAPFVQGGRIGDIGCAAGSWLKHACEDKRFQESDFFGIEITRSLYQLCIQRKDNSEFTNPNIWFSQKNAVTGLVFTENSMNTIHTSSLTHEIESYGSRKDLLEFIKNRFDELLPGGVWINRDVVGPENGNQRVYLLANQTDGTVTDSLFDLTDPDIKTKLDNLSTYSRFLQFAHDFRQSEGYAIDFEEILFNGKKMFSLRLEDACEFMMTKDYTDNWQSEMHETFCFWSFTDWKEALETAGFIVHPDSRQFTNQWIAENRFHDKAELYTPGGERIAYPPTTMICIAQKPL